MKMVVIGGTGLVGSKLVEQLRRDGHEPVEALEGAHVVIAVSTSSRDLLAAESAAGVGHHVMLSAVGADRAQLAEEEVVKAGPVPYTILRATQLFECIGHIGDSNVLVQPVAADDVASALADVAVGSPLNDTVELAGPDVFRLDELVQRLVEATRDPRRVAPGARPDGRSLIPGDDARIASTHFEDWLSQSVPS